VTSWLTLGYESLGGYGGGHGCGEVPRLRGGGGLHQAEQSHQANQQLQCQHYRKIIKNNNKVKNVITKYVKK
jgi:hypothetical protein